MYQLHVLIHFRSLIIKHIELIGNKTRAEEQRKKEKVLKEEQKRAYGAILQLKQRQRAEVNMLNDNFVVHITRYNLLDTSLTKTF